MNDKIIFKYKVVFVIWCCGFHQVVGVGGKDFLFNFCLLLPADRSQFDALLAKCNENKKLNLCFSLKLRRTLVQADMDRDQSLVRFCVVKLDITTGDYRQKIFRMNGSCCRSSNNNKLFHLHDCLYLCMYTNYTISVRTTVFLKMNLGVRNM